VTKAARLLGYKHHYSLSNLIDKHHPELRSSRTPVILRGPRKRKDEGARERDDKGSLKRGETKGKRHAPPHKAEMRVRPAIILHVEDHRVVADAVRDTLELAGFRVVTCSDGAVALTRMSSSARYDLLMFDNHLPGINGLELVRYARQIPHRRTTPIIMLSASEHELEAREAGADVFLRKPEDVGRIVETVERLLRKE
jgi:two-component system chemotaxis response regulator CheY